MKEKRRFPDLNRRMLTLRDLRINYKEIFNYHVKGLLLKNLVEQGLSRQRAREILEIFDKALFNQSPKRTE